MHITEHHRRNFRGQWDRWLDDIDRLDIRSRPDSGSQHTATLIEPPRHDTPEPDGERPGKAG